VRTILKYAPIVEKREFLNFSPHPVFRVRVQGWKNAGVENAGVGKPHGKPN